MADWSDDGHLAFDFETSGVPSPDDAPGERKYALQPWRIPRGSCWATSLVWCQKEANHMRIEGGLLPEQAPEHAYKYARDISAAMLEHAIKEQRRIVGWNTAFDISVLLGYDLEELVFKCKWLDGMLLWKHYFLEPEYEAKPGKRKSYGLKACVEEHLTQFAGYQEDVDFHDPSPEARQKLHGYNVRDTAFTLRLAKKWWGLLTPAQRRCALIEAASLPMIARANYHGMPVDMLASAEYRQYLTDTAEECLTQLQPLGVTEKVVRSPLQLSKLMFDDWGLKVLKENTSKLTGKVSRSTDKEVLHELSFGDPRVKRLREYREALNARTKFAEALYRSAEYNGDGCVHPLAIPFGTYSGRLTYASKQGKGVKAVPIGFAIHQAPGGRSDPKVRARGQIMAPEGYGLLEFDAAGQEYRWMAIASMDEQMLQLCLPGEDPHSYLGANIAEIDYRVLMARLKHFDEELKKAAEMDRKLGKVGNLCVAEGTLVLTDRGLCSIEQVRRDDRVWDGVDFVRHDGVVCSGVKPVVTYAGLTATPDHEVLVDDQWVQLQDAARHGWRIEPSLGSGWSRQCRSAVRIVDGVVRRGVREIWSAVRARAVRLRTRAGCQPSVLGGWTFSAVQGLLSAPEACPRREADRPLGRRQAAAEACQRDASAMYQPERPVVAQLRRTWDQILLQFGSRRCGLYQGAPASSDVPWAGNRQREQRGSLRAGQPAACDQAGQPHQPTQGYLGVVRVYDLVNCGPRARFVANGLIVHNSLQYRTSAKKLRTVARVDYNIPMEMPQASLVHATYRRTYKRVPLYWEYQIQDTKARGYVETFGGRRVQVVGNWGGDFGWSMGSTAINYRIQGTGADQKYLALAVIKDYLQAERCYFAWDLHDGIYLWVPDAKRQRVAATVKPLLDDLPYYKAWGLKPPIPLPWDCKAGGGWGTLREYHP